ncbi:MAG: AgmX/PglI C-terminal domain-containing protein [Alphaproteobacteria bacterium]|nr:AgmX/PglI C-terminal domain-containing protein [Alphaproteobacteria bacterium]
MSHCPFCNAEVQQAVVLHGGTCPQCFAEIPGEETATDPGEEVKATLAAQDKQRAQRRALLPALVGGPVVLAIAAVAAWQFWPQPELEPLTFGEGEFDIDLGAVATYVEPEPEPEQVASAKPTPARAATPRPTARREAGTAVAAEAAPAEAAAPQAGAAEGAGGFDLAIATRRTAALLTNEEDIKSAFRDLWANRAPRLSQCYERSLKSNPDLRGRWRLTFAIGKDGKVADAKVEGLSMSDEAMEACILREMGSWSIYGRLEKPWPVSLTPLFKGG